jgi:proteasome lid subunit RPN8/RPN11
MEIRKTAVEAIVSHATASAPDECCGLLIGAAGRIEKTAPARNIAATPRTKFLVSPEDHFAAIKHAREERLAVIGAYHSHPRTSASPSETDLAQAFDDTNFVQVIVGVSQGRFDIAAYRLLGSSFEALELVQVD